METKRLLIVGASGLVGGNALSYFSRKDGYEVLGSYFSFPVPGCIYLNTLEENFAEHADLVKFKPTHILHTGALTHVDYCEQHEEESRLKTVASTAHILKAAERYGAHVTYISTDYVFDGKAGPYSEEAPVHPLSVYARHKLEAEEMARKNSAGSLILRVTSVYGLEQRNKNFVSRLAELAKGGKKEHLRLPSDQYSTPINAADIARSLDLLYQDNKNGLYHLASTDYVNRVQLAQKILNYFPGHSISLEPLATALLNQPAKRPLQGGLKAMRFLREYPLFNFTNIDDFLRIVQK